jgi:sentrin-specific protease 1
MAPIHQNSSHWWLLVYIHASRTFYCLDSQQDALMHREKIRLLSQFLREEHQRRYNETVPGKFEIKQVEGIPKQNNGYDCGVFVCQYAEHISRGAAFTFSQEDMPRFRIQMAYEITTRRLLTTPQKTFYRPAVEPVSDDDDCLVVDAGLDGAFDSE